MATEFNAICFTKAVPGQIPTALKYRKINNRERFIKFITNKHPDIWYINWYDKQSKNYIERTYIQ